MIEARQGQTLIDVAVGLGADAGAAWLIAERNGVGLTERVAGLRLERPEMDLTGEACEPATDGEADMLARLPIGEYKIGRNRIC